MTEAQKPLCKSCRWTVPIEAIVAGSIGTVLHCRQGVPNAGRMLACRVYEREPGSDDE